MTQPVVGHGVGDPANGVGVALTMQGVEVTVWVTVGPPGVTVTVGVPGVGVGHFWKMKSSADAERPSASNPTTSSAADANTAKIARCNANPFIPCLRRCPVGTRSFGPRPIQDGMRR